MLEAKIARFTESTSGIGRAIAEGLAAHGANVILNGFGDADEIQGLRLRKAAKHGVAGLTKSMALKAAEQGITMNAVCPSYVWTPLVEKQSPDTAKARGIPPQEVINDALLKAQPCKKFVGVEQLAALTVLLASGAAASIARAVIPIDGSWTAQ